jgi:uncharacterized protein YndB with AHSA1/START domain
VQDSIERSVSIAADIETVWSALTTPTGIREWFGDEAEVDLRPGGEARFGWTDYGASVHAVIEVVERPYKFSYRWAASGTDRVGDGPSTLVEFRLTSEAADTIVTVCESGFTSLPESIREGSFADNTSGWRVEMQDLADHLAKAQTAT